MASPEETMASPDQTMVSPGETIASLDETMISLDKTIASRGGFSYFRAKFLNRVVFFLSKPSFHGSLETNDDSMENLLWATDFSTPCL